MSKCRKIILIICPLAALYLFCLPRQLFSPAYSAVLYGGDGTLMGARISADGQWRFPPADEVPEKFEKCIISYEDKRFRRHFGVDLLAIGRALRLNTLHHRTVSGASTITMQVIRLSRPDSPRSLPEKIWEAVLATRLELRCSKREILLMYASNAPFGGNVVGLEAAAWRYFGRPAEELSWAESATLAVLPNAPAMIHPGRNRDKLRSKRDFLLQKLLDEGIIDETEYTLAIEEPLPEKPLPMPDPAYHFLERMRASRGDGKIESSLDPALQRRVNQIAKARFSEFHANLVDNMGILVLKVDTGEVLAYYGNTRGLAPSLRGTDVDMIPAPRSSGSTLKPLLYAAMLQGGQILPTTLVKDTPYRHESFSPRNYSRNYEGAVPADEVIQRSLNVPCVRMLEQYGVQEFIDLLHSAGFGGIDRGADHYGLSLILGGAEISLEELTGAYRTMAAKLAGADDESTRRLALGKGAVWLTFEALSKAGRPEEEASWMRFGPDRRIAWKTGTSWGNRDAWCVGVNRGYAVGVWVGNSDGEGRSGMTGVSYAAPVMFEVFSSLPRAGWFEMPEEELVQLAVCRKSGLPAGPCCPETDTLWVPDIERRPDECRYHRTVHLSPDGRWQVNSSCCPEGEMLEEVRFVLPPAMEWYYSQVHADYRPLPPRHPDFEAGTDTRNTIEIIYPPHNTTVVLTRALDGSQQGFVARAACADPEAELWWHLDGHYAGSTSNPHDFKLSPAPGRHTLTVTAPDGSERRIRFTVK